MIAAAMFAVLVVSASSKTIVNTELTPLTASTESCSDYADSPCETVSDVNA